MALNTPEQKSLVMRGASYQDCVEKIRAIYGRNYELISKRAVEPEGFFAFLKKRQYELTYVVLPDNRFASMLGSPMDFEQERRKILEANKNSVSPQLKLIFDEINSLKKDFAEKTSVLRQDEHPTIIRIQELMQKNEFAPDYIAKICERIRKEYSLDTLDDFESVQKSVVDWIGEGIRIADTENIARPQVVVLVGPTGVGKTTSVAKLAAQYISSDGGRAKALRVRIITIDSYRIAAKEQMETYGEVMGIPVSLANSAEDMQKLMTMSATGVDVILVDTPGHSPKDYESLAKMRKILDFRGIPSQVFLTVSASTKASDLRTIMQQYEIFGYSALIITKMDETDCIGSVISIMDEKNKAVAYFTDGQRVPRDMEKATPVRMLIQLSDFKIDRTHIDQKFCPEKGL